MWEREGGREGGWGREGGREGGNGIDIGGKVGVFITSRKLSCKPSEGKGGKAKGQSERARARRKSSVCARGS